jgi:hypothetical protein
MNHLIFHEQEVVSAEFGSDNTLVVEQRYPDGATVL